MHPGENVGLGKDHTIYSLVTGWVNFKFDQKKKRQIVSVSETINPHLKGYIPPKNALAEVPPMTMQKLKNHNADSRTMLCVITDNPV